MHNVAITGTNRGLGKALAEGFVLRGQNVFKHTRLKKPQDKSYDKYFVGDLLDAGVIDNLLANMAMEDIDIFVNNAAIPQLQSNAANLTQVELINLFNVNTTRTTELILEVYKYFMMRGSGKIININSMYCKNPSSKEVLYGASKKAIEGLMQGLSIDSKGTNIEILDIFLGATATDMTTDRTHGKIDVEEAADTIVSIALLPTNTLSISEIVLRNNVI